MYKEALQDPQVIIPTWAKLLHGLGTRQGNIN